MTEVRLTTMVASRVRSRFGAFCKQFPIELEKMTMARYIMIMLYEEQVSPFSLLVEYLVRPGTYRNAAATRVSG